jgi:hypothetical protein
MPIKKSELYSSLWSSADELRGGMDASQYKDYVLVLLFIKYIGDKYAGVPYAPITIPSGASFKDMVALTVDDPNRTAAQVPLVGALGRGSAGSRRGTNYRGRRPRDPMLDGPTRNRTVATSKEIRV